MTFQDKLEITTSEGVTVGMTIAGIGSRTLAWLLDGLLIGFSLILLGLVGLRTSGADSLLAVGLLSLATLFVPFAYLVGMESLNGGQTLGKMAAGTKVVKTSGAPVGFGSAVIRTLFLPVDVLLFGIGVISMFASEKSQRIGDFAANTVVVRDRVKPVVASAEWLPTLGDDETRWDVSALTDSEVGVLRSFLARSSGLPAATRREYAAQLRKRFEPRVTADKHYQNDEDYLRRVLAEKIRD